MALRLFTILFFLLPLAVLAKSTEQNLVGRPAILYVPSKLPAPAQRSLVIVLHGGLGNAANIASGKEESPLNLNSLAEANSFVVAYLNGTAATRFTAPTRLAWNAGKCCGLPARSAVDDVSYISHAIEELIKKYEINPKRVFGIGHSNGAMMTLKMICDTNLYAAAVAISGPLMTEEEKCSGVRGKKVLAIHGAKDRNVPLEGGQGTQGFSQATYRSEKNTQEIISRAGGNFELQIIPDADHKLTSIEQIIVKKEASTIGAKAVQFFQLER